MHAPTPARLAAADSNAEPHPLAGADDVVSLAPMFSLLRRYRRVLLAGLTLILIGYAGLVSIANSTLGTQVGSIGLRASFEGVEKSRYPNGLPFSPQDIIAPNVLERVFEANQLQQFMTFPQFKAAIYIAQSSPELARLEADYTAQVKDPRLSPVERANLQRDFLARSAALKPNSFQLTFQSRVIAPPPKAVVEKILLDIPAAWAQLAQDQRRVLNYDIAIGGNATAAVDGGSPDAIALSAERVRAAGELLLTSATRVAALPGANLAREAAGTTIQDVLLEIDTLQRVAVLPAYVQAVAVAHRQDPAAAEAALRTRIATERRQLAAAEERQRNLESAYANYLEPRSAGPESDAGTMRGGGLQSPGARQGAVPEVVAQIGPGALEEIIRNGERARDVEYRRALNDRAISAGDEAIRLRTSLSVSESALEEILRRAAKPSGTDADAIVRLRFVQSQLGEYRTRLLALFEQISAQNLRADALLYSIERPFALRRSRSFGAGAVLSGGFGLMSVGLLVLLALCAAHSAREGRRAAR